MLEQDYKFQRQKVYAILSSEGFNEGLTRLQLSRILGIERASICRRVAELRDKGQVWVVKEGLDPISNTRAEFITANKNVIARYRANHPVAETGNLFD